MAEKTDTITFRCPPTLRERLNGSGRSMSDEICARLGWSLQMETMLDEKTLGLIEAVADLAELSRANFSDWYEDPAIRDAFKGALITLVDHFAVSAAVEEIVEGAAPKTIKTKKFSTILGATTTIAEAARFLAGVTLGSYERRTANSSWRLQFQYPRGRGPKS